MQNTEKENDDVSLVCIESSSDKNLKRVEVRVLVKKSAICKEEEMKGTSIPPD